MATAAFMLKKCIGVNAATELDTSKSPNFLSADLQESDSSLYPIDAPVSAVPVYSYEMWLLLECTLAPNNQCDNFKFWGAATQPDYQDTPGNKMTVLAGINATGVTPIDTVSTIATVSQHDNYNGPDPGSFLAIPVQPGDGKIDAIGEQTQYLVLQMKVDEDVQQGNMPDLPFYLSYDQS